MKCEWPVLSRCCFCLPLRGGLLAISYFKFIFSAFMLGLNSYAIHIGQETMALFLHGATNEVAAKLCIFLYVLELVSCVVMLYGAHMKLPFYLRGCFYYGLTSTTALVLAELVDVASTRPLAFQLELMGFCFAGVSTQLYLLTLLWNLIKKLESSSGSHQFENPLDHFISARV